MLETKIATRDLIFIVVDRPNWAVADLFTCIWNQPSMRRTGLVTQAQKGKTLISHLDYAPLIPLLVLLIEKAG